MVLFTTVFGGAIDTGPGRYIDYVVPGIILLCAGYGASTTAIGVTTDMTEGMVDRFRTLRVVGSAVVAGHVIVSVLRNLVSTAVVFATALLLGVPVGDRARAAVAWCLGILVVSGVGSAWLWRRSARGRQPSRCSIAAGLVQRSR